MTFLNVGMLSNISVEEWKSKHAASYICCTCVALFNKCDCDVNQHQCGMSIVKLLKIQKLNKSPFNLNFFKHRVFKNRTKMTTLESR